MRNVFVGIMCEIGVFLWSYKGYDWRDAVAGTITAVCAIGIALFPIAPDTGATASQITIGDIHTAFAAVFFLTLAYFALVLFRKTSPLCAIGCIQSAATRSSRRSRLLQSFIRFLPTRQ
jgi:hypothetical protein